MSIGVRSCFTLQTAVAVNTNIAPATLGATGANNEAFSLNMTASERAMFHVWAPFSLGATGGFRFLWLVPAAVSNFVASYDVFDVTTPATFTGRQTAQGSAFTNASAVASEYWLDAWLYIKIGATAGAVAFQFAQNNSTGNNITMEAGCYCEVNKFN